MKLDYSQEGGPKNVSVCARPIGDGGEYASGKGLDRVDLEPMNVSVSGVESLLLIAVAVGGEYGSIHSDGCLCLRGLYQYSYSDSSFYFHSAFYR